MRWSALCKSVLKSCFLFPLLLLQFRREIREGRSFFEFVEGEITFPPSYRCLKNRPGYSNKKNQNASWWVIEKFEVFSISKWAFRLASWFCTQLTARTNNWFSFYLFAQRFSFSVLLSGVIEWLFARCPGLPVTCASYSMIHAMIATLRITGQSSPLTPCKHNSLIFDYVVSLVVSMQYNTRQISVSSWKIVSQHLQAKNIGLSQNRF